MTTRSPRAQQPGAAVGASWPRAQAAVAMVQAAVGGAVRRRSPSCKHACKTHTPRACCTLGRLSFRSLLPLLGPLLPPPLLCPPFLLPLLGPPPLPLPLLPLLHPPQAHRVTLPAPLLGPPLPLPLLWQQAPRFTLPAAPLLRRWARLWVAMIPRRAGTLVGSRRHGRRWTP